MKLTQGTSLIIVDDDKGFTMGAKTFFKKFGCKIETTTVPGQGLDKMKKNKFDFAIINFQMPNYTGGDLMLMLHQEKKGNMPNCIVYVSDQAAALLDYTELLKTQCFASAVVCKPVTYSELKIILEG